jgi:hypothetical protein
LVVIGRASASYGVGRAKGGDGREYLDFMFPLDEQHLLSLLKEGDDHYNRGRPHLSLGPEIPDTDAVLPAVEESKHASPRDQRAELISQTVSDRRTFPARHPEIGHLIRNSVLDKSGARLKNQYYSMNRFLVNT